MLDILCELLNNFHFENSKSVKFNEQKSKIQPNPISYPTKYQ